MADALPEYLVGEQGIDLVASPLHVPKGGLLTAQNVEFVSNQGIGGVGTRGGLAALTSGALGASVLQLARIPISYPAALLLTLGLNSGEVNAWKTSVDGAVYVNIPSATLQRLGVEFAALWGTATIPRDPRGVNYLGGLYFVGDNYVQGTTAPPVVHYNGSQQFEVFRVPTNPTSAAVPNWVSDFIIANELIYLATYDPGGVAPNHKGRVIEFDPASGSLAELGNRFGNGSGENTAGFPFCLAYAWGKLWAGTYGISGNNQGKVYSLQPGIDETWTLEMTATLHNGYIVSLCPFNGNLYAATDADSSGTAVIRQRTSTGTWSDSLTAPASNTAFFCSLYVFNGLLFAGYYNPNTPKTLIKKYDGTTWTTDKDVTVDLGSSFVPGKPFQFLGDLYWPFYDLTSDSAKTGYVLKRTTGGVWSTAITGIGVRGGLCAVASS